jgi:hypothetical protein
VVRQGSAKPLSAVRFRPAPPDFPTDQSAEIKAPELLGVSVFARARREDTGNVLKDGAGGALENRFQGRVKLVLSFLGNPPRISSRPITMKKGLQRAGTFVFLPGPIPDEFDEIGAMLAYFLAHRLFDFFKLWQGNAKAERDADALLNSSNRHKGILIAERALDKCIVCM